MQNGWIKLHRKVLDNDVYRFDPTAWRVFEYLLLRADKTTGQTKTAYSTMSGYLEIPKTTLHKAVRRLKSAKMVNDSVNGRYTTFTISNWSTYQGNGERLRERPVNAGGTPGEHIQEERIKNKEKASMSTGVDVKTLFNKLVEKLGFTEQVRYTEARRRKLTVRLKEFSSDELLLAAGNIADNRFMQGDNDSGTRYGTVDYLLRNTEVVEKWLIKTKEIIDYEL